MKRSQGGNKHWHFEACPGETMGDVRIRVRLLPGCFDRKRERFYWGLQDYCVPEGSKSPTHCAISLAQCAISLAQYWILFIDKLQGSDSTHPPVTQ